MMMICSGLEDGVYKCDGKQLYSSEQRPRFKQKAWVGNAADNEDVDDHDDDKNEDDKNSEKYDDIDLVLQIQGDCHQCGGAKPQGNKRRTG